MGKYNIHMIVSEVLQGLSDSLNQMFSAKSLSIRLEFLSVFPKFSTQHIALSGNVQLEKSISHLFLSFSESYFTLSTTIDFCSIKEVDASVVSYLNTLDCVLFLFLGVRVHPVPESDD